MIMPANNGSGIVHYLAGKHPGKIGWILSPRGWSTPRWYMPYALDNGCFKQWEPDLFQLVLKKASLCHAPLWVCVPDVVADAEATLKLWHEWHKKIPFNLAFVAQNGHEPQDVPKTAKCCFIGGSTDWKLNNAQKFKGAAPLLHIGRVNTISRLEWAKEIGADSVDGTGFFRGDKKQTTDFIEWFEGKKQIGLWEDK